MTEYTVAISRTYVHSTTITVVANSKEEAEKIALSKINDTYLPATYYDPENDYAEVVE